MIKVYKITYHDPRWNESWFVASNDEARVRQHCEKKIQRYAAELMKDEFDIEAMGLELPFEFRWDGNCYEVTDVGNITKSGKWNRSVAYVVCNELEIVDLDALGDE